MDRSHARSIDEYIAEFAPEKRALLEQMRAIIRAAAPGATETISYSMPTFDLHGRHVVHFARLRDHIGFYPTPSGIDAFSDELARYRTTRGAVQFPLDEPLPADLIRRVVEFRVKEVEAKRSR
jgi:uncharacterized protein YdhG (YjbR/CyaY superfamily)